MAGFPFVPSNPVLSLGSLLAAPQDSLPYPHGHPTLLYTGYGRLAIYYGINALGIKTGENVAIPAFICNAAIAPFVKAGIEVRYYDSDESLIPDLESVHTLIDKRTRAVLSVNYFGFPQKISSLRALCNEHGIYLIEDNAHGFLSSAGDHPLGSFGDISVFSFRKTLPLPNGAALVINNPKITLAHPTLTRDPPRLKSAKFLVRSLLQIIEMRLGINLVSNLRNTLKILRPQNVDNTRETDILEETSLENYLDNMTSLSKRIIIRSAYDDLRTTRVDAYNFWLEYLQKMSGNNTKPLFPNLPLGVVPHSCPVIGNFGILADNLQSKGIECSVWPNLPRSSKGWRFGKVLLLPVHAPLTIR